MAYLLVTLLQAPEPCSVIVASRPSMHVSASAFRRSSIRSSLRFMTRLCWSSRASLCINKHRMHCCRATRASYICSAISILHTRPVPELHALSAVFWTQGDEDEVVPPNQAVEMFEALKGKGVATTLVMFKVGPRR